MHINLLAVRAVPIVHSLTAIPGTLAPGIGTRYPRVHSSTGDENTQLCLKMVLRAKKKLLLPVPRLHMRTRTQLYV